MTEQPVLYELRENIAVLTLNRPHRLNAINLEMLTQLIGRLDDARQDPAVSCAILTGTGRAFCSGEDLKETAAGKTRQTWEQAVNTKGASTSTAIATAQPPDRARKKLNPRADSNASA